ncbi:hypothetical protein CXF83_13115 [Shewanella sp. Choline-02u-19]|uniref:hypothetical protein n=1 Tax=unclassified Shewanella TaxID=196818 RepID=UPI000C32F06B|nr:MULTISPECIES: hypothetical protein [unclassified Shewanella]PKH56331.1 hypothetical protein CXF84_13605 [Shewanella sp. Bg11-22]PKI27575.1 hypothetical protein CXF83_13115 [Shewanella sp. Choline-02u-19]
MNEDQDSPSQIYQKIQLIINELIQKLSQDTSDLSTKETTELSRDILTKLHVEISQQLINLEKNAEWDTFTIALYGETNAGKSTIIETLRIILAEELKNKQQAEFKQWQLESGISVELIEQTRQGILDNEAMLKKCHFDWKVSQQGLEQTVDRCETEKLSTKEKLDSAQATATLLQRFIWLFKKMPQLSAYQAASKNLEQGTQAFTEQTARYQQECLDISANVEGLQSRHQQIEVQVNQAQSLADGFIIGNGRSDFTLDTQSYTFEHDGCKFNILDVPGIEGKEDKVSDAIWKAVHKAHAVFYITSKAAAPQKGDASNPGTLQKIKQHLGAQSEVWSIFNKRIQNPIQLEKVTLVSEGELESLAVLDKVMVEHLGDSYQKSLALSAYPAFLASATCLLPGSRDQGMQSKFLNKFDAADLLAKSNINAVVGMFDQSMVNDFKAKIVRSNKHKAKQIVSSALEDVTGLLSQKFTPLLHTLTSELKDTDTELNTLVATLKSRLSNRAREVVRHFESSVRSSTYDCIDDNISNDDFKGSLESNIEKYQKRLIESMPDIMNKEMDAFETSLKDIVERFQTQSSELLGLYNNIDSVDTSLEVDIDHGINVWGVVGAVGGGIALFWTPVGWAIIAVSAATLVFQLYKAVRSFFSSNYKQSQQRKSTDENISTVSKSINEKLDNTLANVMQEVEANVDIIKQAMTTSVEHIEVVSQKLKLAKSELKMLCKQLES